MTTTTSSSTPVDQTLVDAARTQLLKQQLETGTNPVLTPHRVAEALRAGGRPTSDATILAVYEVLCRGELATEFGGLRPAIEDETLTWVAVVGIHVYGFTPVGEHVSVGEWRLYDEFKDTGTVRRLLQRLAAHTHRRLDEQDPTARFHLAGHLIEVTLGGHGLPDVALIEKNTRLTLADRVELGMLTQAQADLYELVADELDGLVAFQ